MDDLILINKQILAETQRMCSLLEEQLAPRREQDRFQKQQQLYRETEIAKQNKKNEILAMQTKEATELQQRFKTGEMTVGEYRKEQEKQHIRFRLQMLEST